MVPISALPPGIPFTDQMTGASVLNCMVWVTRRLLPVAWMADIFSMAASLRLKPQPAVVILMIARHDAAAPLCHLVDRLAVHILRSALTGLNWKGFGLGKRDARRSDSLKIRKRGRYGNSTFGGVAAHLHSGWRWNCEG